jgi:hypothetical protein
MSNFCGTARTNYFRVKDLDKFKEFVSSISCELIIYDNDENKVGFYSNDCDTGCFPSSIYNEETDDLDDLNIVETVSKHLAEGEIAVFMEAGAEKCRYISGWATAVNDKGERVDISLMDIYDWAEKKFGKKPTFAEY